MQGLKQLSLITLVVFAVFMQGCAAVVVGAGVGAASAAHDRRTLGTQLDDKTAKARLSSAFGNNPALKDANIDISVYNGVVLLAGQASSEAIRAEISKTAQGVQNLKTIKCVLANPSRPVSQLTTCGLKVR